MSKTTAIRVENIHCAQCGMLVGPAKAFHPYLYCWLVSRGVSDPGGFLKQQGFIPDPAKWDEAVTSD